MIANFTNIYGVRFIIFIVECLLVLGLLLTGRVVMKLGFSRFISWRIKNLILFILFEFLGFGLIAIGFYLLYYILGV